MGRITRFGESVAVSGSRAVVGAPKTEKGGAICVYDVPSGKLHSVFYNYQAYQAWGDFGYGRLLSLIMPTEPRDSLLGLTVAVSENTIIAGSAQNVHFFDVKTARHIKGIVPQQESNSPRGLVLAIDYDGTKAAATLRYQSDTINWSNHLIDLEQPLSRLQKPSSDVNR